MLAPYILTGVLEFLLDLSGIFLVDYASLAHAIIEHQSAAPTSVHVTVDLQFMVSLINTIESVLLLNIFKLRFLRAPRSVKIAFQLFGCTFMVIQRRFRRDVSFFVADFQHDLPLDKVRIIFESMRTFSSKLFQLIGQ